MSPKPPLLKEEGISAVHCILSVTTVSNKSCCVPEGQRLAGSHWTSLSKPSTGLLVPCEGLLAAGAAAAGPCKAGSEPLCRGESLISGWKSHSRDRLVAVNDFTADKKHTALDQVWDLTVMWAGLQSLHQGWAEPLSWDLPMLCWRCWDQGGLQDSPPCMHKPPGLGARLSLAPGLAGVEEMPSLTKLLLVAPGHPAEQLFPLWLLGYISTSRWWCRQKLFLQSSPGAHRELGMCRASAETGSVCQCAPFTFSLGLPF